MCGNNDTQDREGQAFESLLFSAFRRADGNGEATEDEAVAEGFGDVTEEERAVLEAMRPDFAERLLAGDWSVERLRRERFHADRTGIRAVFADLLREHGGRGKTLLEGYLSDVLKIATVEELLRGTLQRVFETIDEYDPTTDKLHVWFLQALCREAIELLRGRYSRTIDEMTETKPGGRSCQPNENLVEVRRVENRGDTTLVVGPKKVLPRRDSDSCAVRLASPKFCEPSPETLAEAERLAASIEQAVSRETCGGVRNLRVELSHDGILLTGRCSSYYIKQKAQHAAIAVSGSEELANCIEVV